MKTYNALEIKNFYDNYGEKAWIGSRNAVSHEISYQVHCRILKQMIKRGDRVLEIGPGPGEYTQVLADIGAKVVIVDISSVQLEINRQYARKLGFENSVIDRLQHDICDMRTFVDNTFDAVVCFGPISYVLEQREAAMRELLRVLRPGGIALVGVLSLWAALREKSTDAQAEAANEIEAIIRTGDVSPRTYRNCAQPCHLFRSQEFRKFLEMSGTEVLEMSTSNGLPADQDDQFMEIIRNPVKWKQILDRESEAPRTGSRNTGSHLIAAVRKK